MAHVSEVAVSPDPGGGPFDLGAETAYRAWRARKLALRPAAPGALRVAVADARRLSPDERAALLARLRAANMAIYAVERAAVDPAAVDKDAIRALGAQLGLERLDRNLCADDDGVTSLRVIERGASAEYIPYTDRGLSWHTDGYYNRPEERIRGIVMHCVRPAARGGANQLMDHELAYIRLRDADPELVAALMDPAAMEIPANRRDGVELRAAQTGPVFSVDPLTGALHMRYTARTRNIRWKPEPRVQRAARALRDLFTADDAPIYEYRLGPGEGIICNNVLHGRSAFEDDPARPGRLLYRARYHDRVRDTGPETLFEYEKR